MNKLTKLIVVIGAVLLFLGLILQPSSKTFAQVKSDLPEAAQKRIVNAIVLFVGSNTAYVNNVKTKIDEDNFITPISLKGRTLVPIRFIAESLGAKVSWSQKEKLATIDLNGKIITMKIGQKSMTVNGKQYILDVPAKSISNKTYIPFRAVTDAFGKKIFYDRGLIIISDKNDIFNPKTEKTLLDGIIQKVNSLPRFESEYGLKKYLEDASSSSTGRQEIFTMDMMSNSMKESSLSSEAGSQMSKTVSDDYSTTNVQVAGVDEADIIKTDGKYIYQINRQKIVISEAYPAAKMKIASTIQFSGEDNFNPIEIYIQGDRLVVIGSIYQYFKEETNIDNNASKSIIASDMPRYRPNYNKTLVKTYIYDIKDRKNAKKIREVETEGSYLTSRRIGSSLYIVSNKYVNYYMIKDGLNDTITPTYKDSATGAQVRNIKYSDIRYFPNCMSSNYMVIAGINLENNKKEVSVESYLGAGENVYCSEDNLYVVTQRYYNSPRTLIGFQKTDVYEQPSTLVFKFSLDKEKPTYISKASVPGVVLNQFSMDEYNNYFRIATTVGQSWNTQNPSKNNLYVYNDTMNMVGKIEGIAPGESIYSVRFLGKRAYMVTFKKIDPLFVIDVSSPESPKILGKLKIPGYSDYLHPYDENHIIGFGKDAVDSKEGSFSWYQGMKIAMFDVTDVSKPKEMFKEFIGDRGTESELLNNHKALLFSKEKNILAFPVTVMKISNKNKREDGSFPSYGEFAFQGAYVYNIDLKNGFQLKAKISHMTDEQYLKAGSWCPAENQIKRILYIKDALYTVSEELLKANDIESMKEISSLQIQ